LSRADLILFTPGPVKIPPIVADYLANPPCNYHRQDAFTAMFRDTERDLKRLIGIQRPDEWFATLQTATGTGANEACMLALSGLGKGLIPHNGFFGARCVDQARQNRLEFTALAPFTDRLAGKLSGGMKQKLGLACALLGSPKLLLLDEPGVGVDPLSRRELWRMVSDLVDSGVTVLWSTAYLEEAERCTRIWLLDRGKLLHDTGSHRRELRMIPSVSQCRGCGVPDQPNSLQESWLVGEFQQLEKRSGQNNRRLRVSLVFYEVEQCKEVR
jgi:hypothetical protein